MVVRNLHRRLLEENCSLEINDLRKIVTVNTNGNNCRCKVLYLLFWSDKCECIQFYHNPILKVEKELWFLNNWSTTPFPSQTKEILTSQIKTVMDHCPILRIPGHNPNSWPIYFGFTMEHEIAKYVPHVSQKQYNFCSVLNHGLITFFLGTQNNCS